MSKLSDGIREKREALNLTQEEVARESGYSVAAIRKIEAGQTKTVRLGKELSRVLEFTQQEWADLVGASSTENAFGDNPNAMRIHQIGSKAPRGGDVPVVGRAAASGEPGKLVMLNEVTELIARPPELDGVVDGFAVYVYGESMEPRYFPNERVYVHPYRRPAKGDFCVVQIGNPDPECAYVKRFVSMDEKELRLEQYNPPKEIVFPAEDVHSIGLIVGSGRA